MPFDDTVFLKRSVDVLSFFTEEQLRRVAAVLDRKTYNTGQTVVFQGEISHNFHVIKKGKVMVAAKSGKDKVELAELRAGDFFGEMSLLDSTAATATIRAAVDDTEILTFSRDIFHTMLKNNPPLEILLRERILARKKQTADVFQKDSPQ